MNQDADVLRFYLSLTPRQRDVVYLVSQGLSNREVAVELCIAPSVVAEHLTNIYDLLTGFPWLTADRRANRYTLIRLFVNFFERNTELVPD